MPAYNYNVEDQFLDVTAPQLVEIEVRSDGKVVWVNIDGKCALRICRIDQLIVKDERKKNG